MFFFFTLLNFYISYDSYLLLKYRDEDYLDNDYVFGYYSYWTDWFFMFWKFTYEEISRKPKMKKKEQKSDEFLTDSEESIDDDLEEKFRSFSMGSNRHNQSNNSVE